MKIPRLLRLKKLTVIRLLVFGTLPALYIGSILWVAGINSYYEGVWDELEDFQHRNKLVTRFRQTPEPADLIHFYDEEQTYRSRSGLTSKMQGYKDPDGNIVLPAIYESANHDFFEGLAFVRVSNTRQGFIHPDGSWAFNANFTYVDSFINGRARVRSVPYGQLRWKAGFIDKQGKIVVEVKYLGVQDYIGPYTIVSEPTIYNSTWEGLMDGIDISIGPFNLLFPPARSRFLDKDGNRVSPREVKRWMKDNE
jgi:hypothetical protein